MSEADALFALLRQSADAPSVAAIEHLVRDAPDRELCRVNALAFAARNNLDPEHVIAAFLHAARVGLFELSWNVLCPGCGGVLGANASLKTVHTENYNCAVCAADYEPTLDEMVEVTFTISPRVRRIPAHHPELLSFFDYCTQLFFGSGLEVTADEALMDRITLETVELPPGDKVLLSVQLPAQFLIVFEPVTHAAHFIDVKGEPTTERRSLSVVYNDVRTPTGTTEMRPGPLRISFENRTGRRALPGIWIADHDLHDFMSYRTDTLDIDQRLKITSLTFLFTDLKGSTELYERVGDLAAFDLVRGHFRLLNEIVAAEAGAVVKTIGDAVMATFPTPDRAVAAALRMREAMRELNEHNGSDDLLLKIGIHEGPCLAVTLNERQDYFGQTVNIASRVQGLADSRAIFITAPVVEHAETAAILAANGRKPVAQQRSIRGIAGDMAVYEIP
jgi:class 3 adenylate cyclase